MTGRRLAVAAAGGVVVVVAAVLAFRPAGERTPAAGTAPAIDTVDLAGRRVRLADHLGRPVLVNFWASWCIPCRKEFALLKTVAGGRADVLGVVFQDSPGAAAAFLKDQGATWPGLKDPGGRIARAYGVALKPGIPVTVAVDARGNVAARHVGELRQADLDRLLAAAGAAP
ncbi:MAG TPA: TlpA disulfide reductase family protein [Acidimicrobiales bacterium]|nr:TlpA disulfide reductase family protein [Acidimicrobiales bacterium]